MAGESASADLRNHLNTLTEMGVVGNLSDGSLLERIVNAREESIEAAFTILVERHGPMVLGVCRQVLGNSHDADDACQATFLVLARKAASVRNANSVASWLHGVALRVARRARIDEARRRKFERRSAMMKAKEPEGDTGRGACWPELHEEIARLPERYREPVLLCYLEGQTAELAAQRLGCPRGTILSRLSRARDRLRAQLTRRGVASPLVLTVAGISPDLPAMPAAMLEATVRASLSFVSRSSTAMAVGSTKPAVLAKGVLHAMMISRLSVAGVGAFAGCGIAVLATMLAANRQELVAGPPKAQKTPQPKASASPEGKVRDAISFLKLALSTDDLVEATGLDMYKFRIDVAKGQRFKVVLRSQDSKDAPERELVSYSFEKTTDQPAIVGVSFLRRDRKLSGFLMSNEALAEYRLSCSGCVPGGLNTFVKNPLGALDSTQRTMLVCSTELESKQYGVDARETLLLRVCERGTGRGVDVEGYPRGEVVVVKEQ
jgi:RNA polymerase sigma factor (sigma-70 family)